MIRAPISKIAMRATAQRHISNSTRSNNVVTTAAHIGNEASMSSTPASSSRRAFKGMVYTVLGGSAVVASISHLFKDE
ncbi:hypothetical protein BGZ46_001419, partial [Entomortierella lignicola]